MSNGQFNHKGHEGRKAFCYLTAKAREGTRRKNTFSGFSLARLRAPLRLIEHLNRQRNRIADEKANPVFYSNG